MICEYKLIFPLKILFKLWMRQFSSKEIKFVLLLGRGCSFFLSSPPYPLPPSPAPSKVDRFLNRRSFDFFFKQANKILTLWTNLSSKKEPFGCHFQKQAKQKFEDSDSSSLSERGQCLDRHGRIFIRNVFYCNLTCKGRKPPPESIRNIQGSLLASAISCALSCFITVMG